VKLTEGIPTTDVRTAAEVRYSDPIAGLEDPEVSRRLRLPDFMSIGT
jgi:hypothetical protein